MSEQKYEAYTVARLTADRLEFWAPGHTRSFSVDPARAKLMTEGQCDALLKTAEHPDWVRVKVTLERVVEPKTLFVEDAANGTT